MNRGIIYPGQVPLETDLLYAQQAAMVGLSKLAGAILGSSTLVNGLAVTQTSVASMNVQVAAGEIYSLANLEPAAYSSLPADTTHTILKQGISLDATLLALTAPGTAGFSVNYLIQASFAEVDSVPVTLPYYNASSPSTAYSGPNNTGVAQNTRRLGNVVLSAKAGTAATTGTQTTPAPDAGNVGIAVVTVANGATTVVTANITNLTASTVQAILSPGKSATVQSTSTLASSGVRTNTLSFTPAVAGKVIAIGSYMANTNTAGQLTDLVSVTGSGVTGTGSSSDTVAGNQQHYVHVNVAAGSLVTITQTTTNGSTAQSSQSVSGLSYQFFPGA